MRRTPIAAVLFDVVREHEVVTIAVGLLPDLTITMVRVDERAEIVRLTVDEQRTVAVALNEDLERRAREAA